MVQVWRGESSGVLFDAFDINQTNAGVGFFFAESEEHAKAYAAKGTEPRAFELDTGLVLDLRDVHQAWRTPKMRAVLEEVRDCFDEWVCRYSGDNRDLLDYLEAGDLYDYEGTGSGQRWNQLFRSAKAAGFNSVCLPDYTDGVRGENSIVWVVFDPARIKPSMTPSPLQQRKVRKPGPR